MGTKYSIGEFKSDMDEFNTRFRGTFDSLDL